MPLFGHKDPQPVPATHTVPQTRTSTSSVESPRRGFFSKRRSSSSSISSDDLHRRNTARSSTSGGLFHRNQAPEHHPSTSPTTRSSMSSGGGLFHRNHEDPSISSARQRVAAAEAAEREADRALHQARAAVRDARDHVKMLEREAAEEARLAKIKQNQAADISKRAKPLGRHGVF